MIALARHLEHDAPRSAARTATRRRWTGRSASARLARHVRVTQALPPLPEAEIAALPPARIRLDEVGYALTSKPARRFYVLALGLAVIAHFTFASWSLAQRPQKKNAERITMAVPPPAPEVVEEIVEELPPPPASASASSLPSSSSPASIAAPGPIIPGVTGAGGEGGGLGVAVGAGPPGAVGDSSSVVEEEEPRIEPPRARSRTAPEYPHRAREQGVSGFVSLNILVGVDGSVRDVRVLDAQPPGVFDDAAVAAARRFSFDPGQQDGAAVEAWVRQTIRFALD